MNRTPLKSKHSCELSAAKKLILLLSLLPLWGPGGFAAVQVKSISTDYANQRVTFALSWAAGTRDVTHLSKVWVFVDYQEVTSPNTIGAWQRATVASATATGGAVSGNTGRGFFVQGTDGAFSSTVTVALSGMPAKFNWCATATDYPPQAAAYNNGTYTLKGAAPFFVNNNQIAGNTFAGTITSLTDATHCPGGIGRDVVHGNGACLPFLTKVGDYCRNLTADAAVKITGCGGTNGELEVELSNRKSTTTWWNGLSCPSGWRSAYYAEYRCFHSTDALVSATNLLLNYTYMALDRTNTYGASNGYDCWHACNAYLSYRTQQYIGCANAQWYDGRGTAGWLCANSWNATIYNYKCVR